MKQYLAVGQDVTFVGPDKKTHKAKISQVYNENEALVVWENGSALATHSDDRKGENTFHFEHASPKAEDKK